MSCACGASLPQSEGIAHVLESHPEWAAVDSGGVSMIDGCTDGYIFLSPGIPQVRGHIRSVVADIITSYDVDGIHLDYIRYPGTRYSHDVVSETAYAKAKADDPTLAWEDWQRGARAWGDEYTHDRLEDGDGQNEHGGVRCCP